MFLVRAVFWIVVVMALLPEQRDVFLAHWPVLQREAHARGVDTWLEQSAVRAQDLVAICRREPDLCSDASAAWTGTWDKAYAAAQQMLQHFGGEETGFEPLRKRTAPSGTLNPADMEPEWNAPRRDRKV